MNTIGVIAAALAGLLHVAILYMEAIVFTRPAPRGREPVPALRDHDHRVIARGLTREGSAAPRSANGIGMGAARSGADRVGSRWLTPERDLDLLPPREHVGGGEVVEQTNEKPAPGPPTAGLSMHLITPDYISGGGGLRDLDEVAARVVEDGRGYRAHL
jgi:hypothetical protein